MNLFGHAVIARGAGGDTAVQAGAMLPDLVRMVGLRVPATMPDPMRRGIRLHHRTDAAFHRHPDFVAGAARLRTALVERGVSGGGARAVGHVGWELLLDGELARAGGVDQEEVWAGALAGAASLVPRFDPAAGARFARLCTALAAERLPQRYQDPAFVGARLLAILERRPRLTIPVVYAAAVADALERERAAVAAVARRVRDDVARDVTPA